MAVLPIFFLLLTTTSMIAWALCPPNRFSIPVRFTLIGFLGFFLLTAISTFLLFTGLLRVEVVWMILLLLTLLAAFVRRFHRHRFDPSLLLREDTIEFAKSWPRNLFPQTGVERCLLVCSGLVLLHTLLCALTPEVRSDPLRYHLRLAQQYALRGGIEPLRENPWWAIPQYGESLYALAILLWNDTLAKLIHLWAGVLTFLGVFALTSARFGSRPACWAVFVWAMTPKVSYEITTTYVEMILTVWVFASVALGSLSLASGDSRKASHFLILSGFFMGMAFGTKYTALAVQGLPWLIFPLAFLARGDLPLRRRFLTLVIAGIALLLADSPWLIRNIHHTGNPIYPLYNHLLGLTDPVDQGIENFFLTVWPGQSLWRPSFYLERILGFYHSGYSFPALVVLLPLALKFTGGSHLPENRLRKPDWTVLGFCALSFLSYLLFTGNMDGRFYLPTLALLVCYLGPLIPRLIDHLEIAAWKKTGLSTVMIGLFLFNYVAQRQAFFESFEESPYPILEPDARWDYYARHHVGEPEGDLWERIVPKEAFVYNIGFPYRLKAVHPLVEGSLDRSVDPPRPLPTNIDPLLDPFQASNRTPEDLHRIVRESGVDHLLLPPGPHQRETKFWNLAVSVYEPVEGTGGRLLRVREESRDP